MNIALWIIAALVAVFAIFALWVRFAPHNIDQMHIDPDSVEKTGKPNQYLLSHASDADGPPISLEKQPSEVAKALADLIAAKPNTQKVAGDLAKGHATFVQRTAKMAYPDYITIRIEPANGGGTTLSIYSRARFGYRDFGVNKARVDRWISELRR